MAWTVASGLSDGKTTFEVADFLPSWGESSRQTPAEQLELLRGLAARQEARARVDNR